MSKQYAALEVGGTFIQIAIGVYENTWILKNKITINTTDPDETVQKIYDYLKSFDFESIQIATFGPVCLNKSDPLYGSITSTPKLKWQYFQIGPKLSQLLQKPYAIDTDVNACAMAEYKLGNHGVQSSLAYITVGTGVGIGLIVNGKCVHGMLHPEGGHIQVKKSIQDQNFEGVCAFHKDCLEGLCTNVSIAKRLECSIEDLPNVPDTHPIWIQISEYLASACLNLLYILSIEKIVIGGGVLNRKILYSLIDQHLRKLVNGYVEVPQNFVVPPSVQDVGLIGALLLQQ